MFLRVLLLGEISDVQWAFEGENPGNYIFCSLKLDPLCYQYQSKIKEKLLRFRNNRNSKSILCRTERAFVTWITKLIVPKARFKPQEVNSSYFYAVLKLR